MKKLDILYEEMLLSKAKLDEIVSNAKKEELPAPK